MVRLVAGVLVAVVAVGCGSARARRAQTRCEGFVAALRSDALPRVQRSATASGLDFEAVQFASAPIDPHGGPRPCWLAALAPVGWAAVATADPAARGTVWSTDDGQSRWQIEWIGGSHAADEWPGFLARHEVLPRTSGTLVRDEAGARSHVLVTRDEDDEMHLLMLRWHPPQPGYLRCEARLAGRYASALPAFEAVCATASALWWEWSGR